MTPYLGAGRGEAELYGAPLSFGLTQLVCVLMHDNHHRSKESCCEKRKWDERVAEVPNASTVQELDQRPSNVSAVRGDYAFGRQQPGNPGASPTCTAIPSPPLASRKPVGPPAVRQSWVSVVMLEDELHPAKVWGKMNRGGQVGGRGQQGWITSRRSHSKSEVFLMGLYNTTVQFEVFPESPSHKEAASVLLILIKSTRSCCERPFKKLPNNLKRLQDCTLWFTVTGVVANFFLSELGVCVFSQTLGRCGCPLHREFLNAPLFCWNVCKEWTQQTCEALHRLRQAIT